MAIRCPKCKREYDVTLFEFGKNITCECGYSLGLKHEELIIGGLSKSASSIIKISKKRSYRR